MDSKYSEIVAKSLVGQSVFPTISGRESNKKSGSHWQRFLIRNPQDQFNQASLTHPPLSLSPFNTSRDEDGFSSLASWSSSFNPSHDVMFWKFPYGDDETRPGEFSHVSRRRYTWAWDEVDIKILHGCYRAGHNWTMLPVTKTVINLVRINRRGVAGEEWDE